MFKKILQAFRGAATETPQRQTPLERERTMLAALGYRANEISAFICLREILPYGVGYNCSIFSRPFEDRNVFGYTISPVFMGYPQVTVASGFNDNGPRKAVTAGEYKRLLKNGYSNEEIELIRKGRELWNLCKEIRPFGSEQGITEMVAGRVLELAGNLGPFTEPTPPAPGRGQVSPRHGLGD